MNEQLPPEFEKELHETLNAPNANPVFIRDLRATLIERSNMKQQTRTFARMTWGFAIAIIIALLVVASPRAAAALKQLFGYVPGVGFVEAGESLRVLSAPVTVEKDGLTVTVEKGTADSQQTVLLVQIEGYTSDPYNQSYCDTLPRLVLPNGTSINETQAEYSQAGDKSVSDGKYFGRHVFEALPAGQLDATLEMPCVMFHPDFSDFKFQLHFKVADATQMMPVIELPTVPAPLIDPATAPVASTASTLEGFAIVLESETSLADGYILTGSYQWSDPRFDGFSAYPSNIQITDANGKDVNIELVDPITTNTDSAVKKLPFAIHIPGKKHAFPLTISVKSIIAALPDTATFQFDAGANPQVGQTWNTNIDVPIAGHIIHVQNIQLTAGRTPAELGFTFSMTSDSAVTGATVVDINPTIKGGASSGGGGGGGGGADGGYTVGPFTSGWAIDNYSPAGVKTFEISGVGIMFDGSWQVMWQPSTP